MAKSNYLLVNSTVEGFTFYNSDGVSMTGTQPTVDNGSAIKASTQSTTLNNVGLSLTSQELYGAQIATGIGGIYAPVVAGTNVAKMEDGYYIMMRGGAQTEKIHGDTGFTVLRGAANYGTKTSIHNTKIIRSTLTATALRDNKWNQVSGVWDSGYPEANTSGMYDTNNNADLVGTGDKAANPTSAIPGRLVYKEPKLLPEQDSYKERFLW